MRRLIILLPLSLLAIVPAPAQAGGDFATLERCERYLERWRSRMDRKVSGGWQDINATWQAAYCTETPDGRFVVVYPVW